MTWAGQYEYFQRARAKFLQIVPLTLALIVALLYLIFGSMREPMIILATLPLALVGGVWLVYLLGYSFSVAVAVGFIALAGVTAEFGVVMLVYLQQSVRQHRPANPEELRRAVLDGAVRRVRPKAMTVAVILAGLLPIMLGSGAGSEIMKRIAVPMVGGMLTAPVVSMFLVPLVYFLWMRRRLFGSG